MIAAHIRTALRGFMKNKGYLLINVLGLAIGMAIFFLIAMYVKDEASTDRFHKNLNEIHRLETDQFASTPMAIKKLLGKDIPEVRELCRLMFTDGLFSYKDKSVSVRDLVLADANFFEIFSFKLVSGNPQNVLSEPQSLVISESQAKSLFGEEDPIGKTLVQDQKTTYKISGVMEDFPSNSSIEADMIGSLEILKMQGRADYLEDYNDWSYQTFLLLGENLDYAVVNEKVKQHLNDEIHAMMDRYDFTINFLLRPMEDIYFEGGQKYDHLQHGSLSYIYIYTAIGIFILFIAVVNFVNLATATASRRSREIGLKKVIGAGRPALIRQFLTESVLISLLAFLLAALLVELLTPVFNRLILAELNASSLFNLPVLGIALLFSVFIGVLAGLYPALYLTRFQAASILKGEQTKGKKGLGLRRGLIVFQFTISIVLIISAIIIFSQMKYARSVELGFNKEHVVFFNGEGDISRQFEQFRAELLALPEVKNVAVSSHVPGYAGMTWGRMVDTSEQRFNVICCDPAFVDLLQIKITEGRNFHSGSEMDMQKTFIVNETFVERFDLKNPLGTQVSNGEIIGVMKDFSFASVHRKIGPMAFVYKPEWCNTVSVKIAPGNIPASIDKIRNKWDSYATGFPFNYHFLDQAFDRLYRSEEHLAELFGYFSALAIFIAAMGLAGLALFSAQQKTREIGIRMVFGASRIGVIRRMAREFTFWVIIANLIAWPLAYYLMKNWLDKFAYHINPQIWMFLLAAMVAFLIAFITVSYHAWRTASANPVDSLRYE
mgnify:CR=1 FL=1